MFSADIREKNRLRAREWRKNNPEKVLATNRKHESQNRAKRAAKSRKWNAENPERRREYQRNWYAANPERQREYRRKYREIALVSDRKRRGLPTPTRPCPENCELCGVKPSGRLVLDHDHDSGQFRGWLCAKCNRGLGLFGDSLEGVERAATYLKGKSSG